jgi:hypothetical protein
MPVIENHDLQLRRIGDDFHELVRNAQRWGALKALGFVFLAGEVFITGPKVPQK